MKQPCVNKYMGVTFVCPQNDLFKLIASGTNVTKFLFSVRKNLSWASKTNNTRSMAFYKLASIIVEQELISHSDTYHPLI